MRSSVGKLSEHQGHPARPRHYRYDSASLGGAKECSAETTSSPQTIYWNKNLRLCDCPGLVCPSSAGYERQVLGGVLPIQNVESVLHFVGQRMPLEKPLRLRHEDEVRVERQLDAEAEEDEFSLDTPEERAAQRRTRVEQMVARWTTDELLSAYAEQQGELSSLLLLAISHHVDVARVN